MSGSDWILLSDLMSAKDRLRDMQRLLKNPGPYDKGALRQEITKAEKEVRRIQAEIDAAAQMAGKQ